MPRGGARPGAGRKPGSTNTAKALAKAEIKARARERAAPIMEGMLDSLEVMRRGLQIMVNEVAPALKLLHDLSVERRDLEGVKASTLELKRTVLDAHTIAKDLAPYEHRRLAGEKPLAQDAPEGPPVLVLTAAEIAQ